MRTNMMKLWQTLLGTLVVSSLACGGSSGSGGTGHDGGLDGGETLLDGATAVIDQALLAAVDQAVSGIDQATPAIDQAPAVDLGTVKLDGGTDADVRASDTLIEPDVPSQPDLAGPPDVFVKQDVTPGPDLRVPPDAPADVPSAPDVPTTSDLRPPADLTPALDLPDKTETPPALDTSAGIDTTGGDSTPQILWPDKLTYSPGEQLTANFTNGSTDTNAWIGIFPVGAGDDAYRDWAYTAGATSGTMILHVPGTPGTYELRMFQDSGYTRIATSVPFTVVE